MPEQKKKTEKEERSIEELFSELEAIAEEMEEGEVSLERSFELYESGMRLIREADGRIARVEQRMEEIAKETLPEAAQDGSDEGDLPF